MPWASVTGMANPVIVVVGAGPGIGAAVARRYGRAGYDVALLARSEPMLAELGRALQSEGVTAGWFPADITAPEALTGAITRFGNYTGQIDVLHYNPSAFREKDPLELTPDELVDDVRLGVAGLLTAVQAARPFMSAGARVTVTGSRAADRPWHRAASLGVQKAAVRNLVQSIDATLAPDGIRAMSLTVNGTLAPNSPFSAERIAEALFGAVSRKTDWQVELSYNG